MELVAGPNKGELPAADDETPKGVVVDEAGRLPVVGMALGAVFLDEAISAGLFAGLAMVLGSIVIVNGIKVGSGRKVSVDPGVGANGTSANGVIREGQPRWNVRDAESLMK